MIKMKTAEKLLIKKGFIEDTDFYRSDNNQKIIIRTSCKLSEKNFYDYDEKETPLTIDDRDLQFIKDDFRFTILRCEDCCCCAGW